MFRKSFDESNLRIDKNYTAGTYVCNSLLYQTLNYLEENKLDIPCGFIHVPELSEERVKLIAGVFNQICQYLKSL